MIYPAEEVVRFIAYAFPEAEERSRLRALDLGSGSGRHTVLLSRSGFRTFALDYSLQAARNVRTFLAEEDLAGSAACGSLDRLPFRDNSLDVVLPWECIFYGDEAAVSRAVAEVRTLLNRGEWDGLLFTVYDEESARALFADGFDVVWFDRYSITRRNETSRDAGWMLLVRKK
jgi:SAM-dependent methyltransferase